MKLTIPTILMALALTTAAGCGKDTETVTIVAPEDTDSSISAPTSKADGAAPSDEIIAPKEEAPAPAPVPLTGDSGSDSTSPTDSAPAKAPEDTTPAKEGDKTAEAAPETPVIIKWIMPIELISKKTLKLVATKNIHTVTCQEANPDSNCGGAGGTAHELQCPRNYVVTGYELGAVDFGCPDGSGGCADYTVVGGLRITCARPTPLNIDPETSDFAYDYSDTSRITVGEGSFDDRRPDSCAPWSGVATGLFGRGGDRLDSVGFQCGTYSPTETNVTIYRGSSAKKATYSWSEVTFGLAPGIGGAPFSISCPEGEAVVGVTVRSGAEVDGISAIQCAELDPILN